MRRRSRPRAWCNRLIADRDPLPTLPLALTPFPRLDMGLAQANSLLWKHISKDELKTLQDVTEPHRHKECVGRHARVSACQ